ncbi:Post-segregation antitoxin CcdA [Pseudoduganella namucuonensis]|uniref:Post-segregation antitoxin CcdA n=2 Tax=Pseudoduganella namucuonensis TaxID=1035707 RepID=A0A1I7I886_9BURK|nr:Post-segregation antitoxin CcdA [Pseudoduganella namucuonensis]
MVSVSYFNLIRHSDGRVEFVPTQSHDQWVRENREALEAYAWRIASDGSAAARLRRYLAAQPGALATGDSQG